MRHSEAGAKSVTMAGRLLGLIPDVETFKPMFDTTLGIGGYWNLPLTCYWLALSRARIGRDKPLIGINGAQTGLDIARMMLAGASGVRDCALVRPASWLRCALRGARGVRDLPSAQEQG